MVKIYSSGPIAKRIGMTKLIKVKFKLSDLKDEDKREGFANKRQEINSSNILSPFNASSSQIKKEDNLCLSNKTKLIKYLMK